MDTTNLMTATESQLAALYTNAGLPCQINAGAKRLVVYAATPEIVRAVAGQLVLPTAGTMGEVLEDSDEEPETRFYAVIKCDLSKFSS